MTDTTHDFRAQHFIDFAPSHFDGARAKEQAPEGTRAKVQAPTRREFPPDFIHGDATLDELYDAFGEAWAERVAFVQYHVEPGGELCGVSVAGFDDWFLAVEHTTVAEGADDWLADRLVNRDLVVELITHGTRVEGTSRGWIEVRCSIERLLELEQRVLHVHRECPTGRGQKEQGGRDEQGDGWITHAETNMLSLVTLCARLGLEF